MSESNTSSQQDKVEDRGTEEKRTDEETHHRDNRGGSDDANKEGGGSRRSRSSRWGDFAPQPVTGDERTRRSRNDRDAGNEERSSRERRHNPYREAAEALREVREGLPVTQFKDQLLDAVRDNQVIVVIGETGSGKTTQIPQFLVEAGYAEGRRIVGVTQPRRVATVSVAQRVAEEYGCRIGDEVGYSIRFDDCTSEQTRLKFLTDGVLVRECLADPSLSRYGMLVLDEAHERSVNTDVLFGLLKQALVRRPDLKLLVTSATLDCGKFSKYYGDCPVLEVPGRTYPVDIYHSKKHQVMTASGPASRQYVDDAVEVVMKIHRKQEEGHVLVFLTGRDEIEDACAKLRAECAKQQQQEREQQRHGGGGGGAVNGAASAPAVQRTAHARAKHGVCRREAPSAEGGGGH